MNFLSVDQEGVGIQFLNNVAGHSGSGLAMRTPDRAEPPLEGGLAKIGFGTVKKFGVTKIPGEPVTEKRMPSDQLALRPSLDSR